MALTLIVMLGIVGLSLDWALGALVAHQLHNGADAGALAGALVVKMNWPQAMSDAIAIAHLNAADQLYITVAPNGGDDPAGEVVVGRWVRQLHQFFPTTASPNAVKVWANRPGSGGNSPAVALLFGPIFGTQTVDIRRHAIAYCTGATGAGIIVLSQHPELDYTNQQWTHKGTGFVLGGNTRIDLRGVDPVWGDIVGDMQVNAVAMGGPDAFVFNGSTADIHVGDFKVVGSTNPVWDDSDAWAKLYPPPPEEPFSVISGPKLVSPMPDPLGNLVPPDVSTMAVPYGAAVIDDALIARDGYSPPGQPGLKVLELSPGYYPGGIEFSGAGGGFKTELRFKRGSSVETSVFALGGGTKQTPSGLVVGGGDIVGQGVMLYLTGTQTVGGTTYSVNNARLNISGNGYIELSPPGDYFLVDGQRQVNGLPGVSIWQDRDNHNTAELSGTANYNLSGTLYMGYNPVTVSGNISKAGNQLLAGALDLSGGLNLGIAYDGRNRDNSLGSCLVE